MAGGGDRTKESHLLRVIAGHPNISDLPRKRTDGGVTLFLQPPRSQQKLNRWLWSSGRSSEYTPCQPLHLIELIEAIMPHTTAAYGFELKILGFAGSLSAWLAGEEGRQSFVMVFSENGTVRTLQFDCPGGSWHQLTQGLDHAGTPYLFYDPFDAPDYTWLSWRRIERSTMERLIEASFESEDFVKSRHASARAGNLDPPATYPASWGVMF